MKRLSTSRRRNRLAARHFLSRPAATVEDAAQSVVGLHSSDPSTVFLSAWARVAEFTVADLERALYEDCTLLRIPGMRRTLFAVPVAHVGIVSSACTRRYADSERDRLARMLEEQSLAADGQAWIDQTAAEVLEVLADGPATGVELTREIPELAKKLTFGEGKTWGGTFGVSTRLFFVMAVDGTIVRGRPKGTWVSGQYRWAAVNPPPLPEPSVARADLVRLWLQAFGPGTLTDVKWWMGWTVGDTKKALEQVGAVEVELDHGIGFVLPSDNETEEAAPDLWVALLPSLDPTIMGWKERNWFLGGHDSELFDRNGNAGPTIWADGRVIGGWGQTPDGEIRYQLVESVGSDVVGLVEAKAAELTTWLDGTVIKPRFQSPLGARLNP